MFINNNNKESDNDGNGDGLGNSNGNNNNNNGNRNDEVDAMSGGDKRFCKICFGTDSDVDDDHDCANNISGINNEWMHPCKCSGTIKWVHRNCLTIWLDQAPYNQRYQCTMCKYRYHTCWRIKPLRRWCSPNLQLNMLDGIEISMDMMFTYMVMKRVAQLIQGTSKSFWRPYFWFAMWRMFVMNNRRLSFYFQLAMRVLGSVLETSVQNVK